MGTLLLGLVVVHVLAMRSREQREAKQRVVLPKGLSALASVKCQEKMFVGRLEPTAAPAFPAWK